MPHARKLLNERVASTHLIIRMYFQTKSTRNGYIFQIIGVNIFVGALGPIFYSILSCQSSILTKFQLITPIFLFQ